MREPLTFLHFLNSDRYQYTESSVLLMAHQEKKQAVFEYFFRRSEDGGYSVVAGTTDVAKLMHLFNITPPEERRKYFAPVIHDKALLEYLCQLQFKGNIYAMQEGDLAYPYEPIIIVEGDLITAKILETPLLNLMNFQMTIASKANRIRRASGSDISLFAFGSRRAHGLDATILGTKAALIGGCDGHSSLAAELLFEFPSIGTMSHSYIQAFGIGAETEFVAFDTFVKQKKDDPMASLILLIDTYDTLSIGLNNAIACFQKNKINDSYPGIYGIRIDSGDLAYLSKYARKALDNAQLFNAQIILTNSLDEYLIEDLIQQGACFDSAGIGDAIAVNRNNPCFGGVYKMAAIDHKPVMKLSEEIAKTTTPELKKVYRIYQSGIAAADLLCLASSADRDKEKLLQGEDLTIIAENNKLAQTSFPRGSYTTRDLLVPLMLNGELTENVPLSYHESITLAKKRLQENMDSLSAEHLRLTNPHLYKVDLSTDLYTLKTELLKTAKKILH